MPQHGCPVSVPKSSPKQSKDRKTIAELLLISQIPVATVIIFANVDSSIVRQSAQGLIPVAGFLASAAIAMTFFYSGKLLDFISPTSPIVENLRQPIRAFVTDSLKKGFKPILDLKDPNRVSEALKDTNLLVDAFGKTFKQLANMTDLGVKSIMESPREITRIGSASFAFFVVSAFFSVLTMLSGEVLMLGLALNFLILGASFLIWGWFQAQNSVHAYLTGAYLIKVVGLGLDLDNPAS